MISYIDVPRKREVADYSACVDHLIKKISADENALSIYRFGNVTTPGISDVDLLVVFRDGNRTDLNPFEKFPDSLNGLFTHGVDAVCESHVSKLMQFSFLENMNLVYGIDTFNNRRADLSPEEVRQLGIQVALEFLITNYVDIVLQLEYGIVKLRAFLQHTKGLIYDLRLLGITSGNLYEMIEELRNRIKNWWSVSFSPAEFSEWIRKFFTEYERFIRSVFQQHAFYFPRMKNYFYLKNVELENAPLVSWKREGITLPNSFSFLGKRYFNLQRRLNKYTFQFPIITDGIPAVLRNRYNFFEEMKEYNNRHFPFFDTLTTGFRLNEK